MKANENKVMTLGERLKIKRKEIGLSQEELAERLNVKQEAISKIENGRLTMDVIRLSRVSEILGTTPNYLVWGDIGVASEPENEWLQEIISVAQNIKNPMLKQIAINQMAALAQGEKTKNIPKWNIL